jgi:hypothetical protein
MRHVTCVADTRHLHHWSDVWCQQRDNSADESRAGARSAELVASLRDDAIHRGPTDPRAQQQSFWLIHRWRASAAPLPAFDLLWTLGSQLGKSIRCIRGHLGLLAESGYQRKYVHVGPRLSTGAASTCDIVVTATPCLITLTGRQGPHPHPWATEVQARKLAGSKQHRVVLCRNRGCTRGTLCGPKGRAEPDVPIHGERPPVTSK